MFIRIFGLFALVFALFVTQTRAATSTCVGALTETEVPMQACSNVFMPGTTTGVYDFTGTGDGKLVVHFVTVLTTFTLTVTVDHMIDGLAESVFPPTTMCVTYGTNSQCDEYDFTGNVFTNPPHFVPVQNTDYKGLITLTLSYLTFETAQTPAFLHAPGASTVYTEDILTNYSSFPLCNIDICGDPTMKGKTPGLSTVAAFDEHLPGDNFCLVSPKLPATFKVGEEIEVAFRLTPPSVPCGTNTGNSIRDKDTRLSVVDSQGNFVAIQEEGNKFQFDKDDGVNERDLNTEGLLPGTYTVTLFSDEFSPYSFMITLTRCTGTHCNE